MRSRMVSSVSVLVLAVASARSQAPQYTIHDLGGDNASLRLGVSGINANGQVVGSTISSGGQSLAFRTKPNSPIDLPADYLGTLGGTSSQASGINAFGQVVGSSQTASGATHGFRTATNALINPLTDDIGTLGGPSSSCSGINDSGQVVGESGLHAFRTAPNAAINPATDDLGALPFTPYASSQSGAESINSSGHVAGHFLPHVET